MEKVLKKVPGLERYSCGKGVAIMWSTGESPSPSEAPLWKFMMYSWEYKGPYLITGWIPWAEAVGMAWNAGYNIEA